MKIKKIFTVLVPVLVAALLVFSACRTMADEEPVARGSYSVPVYIEQDGDKLVVGSGGEIEIQSGATFDLQSGATTDFSGGIDLDGALLDIDADGDTSIQADTDDQIDIEISAADDFRFTANTFTALSGSTIAANTIAETTAANGVAVDGLTIKDGGLVGDLAVTGTTPALTIGDAGEEDAQINFDGAAQDFHVGLDDTADDLVVGVGTALGTTTAFAVDENAVTSWTGGMIGPYEIVQGANVLTTAECGKTMFLNAETEFATTLPAVSGAAGCSFTFIVASAPVTNSYTIITGNSLENVLYGVTHEADDAAAGPIGAGVDTLTSTAGAGVIGDWIQLFSDGTYWYYVAWVSAGTGWEPSTAD